ncbi:two-component system, chemotaxis family, chemotaxis protein CheV [Nitratiruptor sp. YY08-26]|uniref:chemotaxis protein n=1 Tax=unclassified Nitratiruptor TaxID=2624044 RepID=UPI0019151FFB|nr:MULTISPECIES: chemotaxis protein [unclassified Nitratiruptor]BCD61841.1 two-component system, chemotaxis family, chemotaxis protein CheV [Nitratiruptor sp. YY08-13]BCD65776.1 two-component system, chemotaxis family, chemotaxis protein CheV [Nitratiruptor sp. YY08-26]
MRKKEYLPKILETGANELEVIDFRMFEELEDGSVYEWVLGVNVAKVKEVIQRPTNIFRSPGMPPEVEGLAKIREDVIPIVNLEKWMKIKAPADKESKYAIVMEFLREIIGILVHEAKRIRRIKWTDIKKPPASVDEKLGGKVVGVIEIEDNQLLLLLDFEGILDELGMIKVFNVEDKDEYGKSETSYNILILDDSPVARKIIRKILTQDGHNVYEVESGIDGLKYLESLKEEAQKEGKDITDKIQLIISDIEMPGMDGLTFTKKVKEDPVLSKIPVVINTSLSDKATVDKTRFVNADAHLVKFDTKDLLHIVHEYAIKK